MITCYLKEVHGISYNLITIQEQLFESEFQKYEKFVHFAFFACFFLLKLYTQYIKKSNTYIFVDNLSNFKDVHFKLAGYID